LWFFAHFLVGTASLLEFAVLLLLAAHGLVACFEGFVHNERLDVGCEGLTRGLGSFDEDLQEEGGWTAVVVIL
jgi:hypothetical protein